MSKAAPAQTKPSTVVAFARVTVIDGTGAPAKSGQTVVISGDRITAVGPSANVRIPRGSRVINGAGKFLIPGLWDAHVHTRYEGIDHFRLLIANGITSARNMSAPWEYLPEILRLREEIAKGDRIGPRLLTAGPVLDGPGPRRSTYAVVNNADEARQAVRRVKSEGADFVKVYNGLSRESFFAIAAEAKAQGLPFVGHLPYAIRADEASDAGQLSIEHVDAIVRAASTNAEEIARQLQDRVRASVTSVDVAKLRVLAERLRKNRTSIVPTLSNYSTELPLFEWLNEHSIAAGADRFRYVPAGYVEGWKQVQPRIPLEDLRRLFEQCRIAVRELDKAGVTILAGTDVGQPFLVPGFSLHDELSMLVKAGLSEMQTLETATRNPARTFNLTDQGTIETGMRADLVLLDSNPLENINNTRKIRTVVAAGRVFERNELDAMLSDVQRAASQWTGTPTR
jgi:imidazolonepropionase-like amidohydrolase